MGIDMLIIWRKFLEELGLSNSNCSLELLDCEVLAIFKPQKTHEERVVGEL